MVEQPSQPPSDIVLPTAAQDRQGRSWARRLLLLPPILLGVGAVILAGRSGDAPIQAALTEVPRAVRVITAAPLDIVPQAIGYGVVEPAQIWRATAEVPGTVVRRHGDLELGRILIADLPVFELDSTDLALTQARLEADLERLKAQQSEIDQRERNLNALRDLQVMALDLADRELARQRDLTARGAAARATLEDAENARVTTAANLQSIENDLAMIPIDRAVIAADTQAASAQLQEAVVDLERTVISTPFPGRVSAVSIEEGEYVGVGTVMAEIQGIAQAEVSAKLALDELYPLIGQSIDPASIAGLGRFPQSVDGLGLTAEVHLIVDGVDVMWPASVARLGDTVDPSTRSVGVVALVQDPYRSADPGERPPLVNGMFVEVVIKAPRREGQIIVPRTAITRDPSAQPAVMVVDDEDRLRFRPVVTGLRQDGYMVIREGIVAGDRIVISDVTPASEGMALTPTEDEVALQRLHRAAGAEGAQP